MRLRLSTRLILGIVLIEALMLSLLVGNSVRLISTSHGAILERTVQEEARLLGNLLAPGLAFRDRASLQDALNLIADSRNLVYAEVLDRKGRRMAEMGAPPTHFTPDADYASATMDGVFDVEQPIALTSQRLGTLHLGISLAEVQAITRETRLQNTLIALAEILLSILATVALALMLTRSLRKLEQGAHALREGRTEHRIDLDSRDEIGDVARAFNAMADQLQATLDKLRAEHRLLEQETERLDTLVNGIHAVIWEASGEGLDFDYVSGDAESLLGVPREDWLRPGFLFGRLHPDDSDRLATQLHALCRNPEPFNLEFRVFRADDEPIWLRAIGRVERDGETCHLRGLLIDVSEQKSAQAHILYLAEHDPLTDLINRRRFQEELEHHIAWARRYGEAGALLFIDLDQFKYINDTFGHGYGDECLVRMARCLQRSLRETDILGRLGGDEFGVILPRCDREAATQVAEELLRALGENLVSFGSHSTTVGASIGIVLFPDQGTDPNQLLAMADTAMYAAKEQGRNRYYVFDARDQTRDRMQAKLHWESRIREALDNDGFVLHYQPIVELASGRASHYEVLLRMRDASGGLIEPERFLGIAERFGMIRDIDRWVLRAAIRQQAESTRGGHSLALAINLSGVHFDSPEIIDYIHDTIEAHGADPRDLIFEVTETAAVGHLERAELFLESLRQIGCRFALDDFGVGFSSLHYLKHLTVDFIKIDGSFVRSLHEDDASRVFVRSMADLARGLGITCIAEFVQNAAIVDELRALGVPFGQGHHLGRPTATLPRQPANTGREREPE